MLCLAPTLEAKPSKKLRNIPRVSTYQEMVPHVIDGNSIRVSLPSSPVTLQVQSLNPISGQWRNIITRKRPSARLSRIKIPQNAKDLTLRVVATYAILDAGRVTIPSSFDAAEQLVTFDSYGGARLYSIEARPNADSAWSRVSTMDADATATNHQVFVPSSIASTSEIRVVAVLSQISPPVAMLQSLPTAMWHGPFRFAGKAQIALRPLDSEPERPVAMPSVGQDVRRVNIEESDIWKIRGNTMYFFNCLRGLQVIDSSDPSHPQMTSMELPAAGEEMYLLGGDSSRADRALLVTAIPWSQNKPESTRIHDISFLGRQPQQGVFIDIPGSYQESRLIGHFLHIITTEWSSDTGIWQPQTYVSTIDVADGQLAEISRRSFDFSASQVGATSKYLWISTDHPGDWNLQCLVALAIHEDGSLGDPQETTVGGRIQDKWKVGDTSNGLAVVVQKWQDWEQVTSVETYQLDDTRLFKIGAVELVRGESLFATRFADDRCYVVTFRQADPLWIVDLADPNQPTIRGHLEVPGWSTYIQPIGDVLIAVGSDGGKVQVSLFDVSDPDLPTLAQRIDVGTAWSWSEAEWNEKAVRILEESGLILIPVVETKDGETTQRVSLIDFDANARTLTARGVIDHNFSPRRATLLDDGIIASISNRQLLLVDASNRDLPRVITDQVLAFGVDRVIVHNDVALMLENGQYDWTSANQNAVLRTAPTAQLDQISYEIPLPCASVSAARIVNNRLVLVEESSASRFPFWVRTSQESVSNSQLSVWSLDDPAHPTLLGRTNLPFQNGITTQLVEIAAGRIVVTARTRGWFCWVRPLPVIDLRTTAVASRMAMIPPVMEFGGQGMQIAIADVGSDEPTVLGSWNLEGESYSEISEVFACDDLLAFSFQQSEAMQAYPVGIYQNPSWSTNSTRSWLQILDLANPLQPMPWARVQIPGKLLSITAWSRAGATIFTRSGDRIAALGFNGETAPIIAEAETDGSAIMIASTLYQATADGVVRRNFSSQSGTWDPATIWPLDQASGIHTLLQVDGSLAAISQNHAWILGDDESFQGYSIIHEANFNAAAVSGNAWIVPAGEYGVLTLSP